MFRYHIKVKRDFGSGPGWLINGRYVRTGFVVTDGFCNIMPGATWFLSIADAVRAIHILALHGPKNFHSAWRAS